MQRDQDGGNLVAFGIKKCRWHVQYFCELDGNLKVRLVDADLVAVDSCRSNRGIDARSNPQLSLREARRQASLFQTPGPNILSGCGDLRSCHKSATRFVVMINFAYYELRSRSLGQSDRNDRVGGSDQPHTAITAR